MVALLLYYRDALAIRIHKVEVLFDEEVQIWLDIEGIFSVERFTGATGEPLFYIFDTADNEEIGDRWT